MGQVLPFDYSYERCSAHVMFFSSCVCLTRRKVILIKQDMGALPMLREGTGVLKCSLR